ncbi:MAG: flagellar filament capping protein FliD [Geminicoccales bacterium]
MATNLNLDSLNVDSSGQITFSGLSSGIDARGAVDGIIAAKRIPIDNLERRISDDEARLAVLNDIQTLTSNLREAADSLRGNVSFDGSTDIFEAKTTFASSTRTDTESPSAAAEVIGLTTTNRAQAGTHTIEVQQVASAHKIASGAISGATTDALGLSGAFDIGGTSITIDSSDTLLDLRDKINAANTGDSATGITASFVSISAAEHVFTLTADESGEDAAITVADTSGSVLETLGFVDSAASIVNELQPANNAQISVDGLDSISGVSIIERQSNTIDDVFDGVTLSLFKAEPGTTIKVDIERDLNQVKSAIIDVVDSYNELRTFINTQAQSEIQDEDGEISEGLLAGSRVLSEIRSSLSGAIGSSVDGSNTTFSSLADIGITIQGSGSVASALFANTLVIDETKLDDALLTQSDDVKELFSFGLSSSSSDVLLVGFNEQTNFDKDGYSLNVAYSGGQIVSANINGPADGTDDGSVTVDGQRLTVNNGGAEGLQLLYTGNSSVSGIQLGVSVGIGAQLHAITEQLLDNDSGAINSNIETLTNKNELAQTRVDTLDERLEREREHLLERFANMESALASMNNLLESIRSQIDSAFGS